MSTISREIKRNTGDRGYRYKQADAKAIERRKNVSSSPKKLTPANVAVIEEKLLNDWSPEQISGRLEIEGIVNISHETIYQHIWKDKRSGCTLYKHLRHNSKKYNKRSSGKAGRGCIPNHTDINERPKIVEEKSRIGDWEVTFVDPHSKFTRIKKMKEVMTSLPYPVRTVTFDNGMEFEAHQNIAEDLNASCYFATPYHP